MNIFSASLFHGQVQARTAGGDRRAGPKEKEIALQTLLGPAPLLEGENAADYDALKAHLRTAVDPKDIIEKIWIRDIVDLLWETLRLRRLKIALIRSSAHEGLARVLRPLTTGIAQQSDLVEGWARNKVDDVQIVAWLLQEAGLDETAIDAKTVAVKLDTLERMNRLIAQSEARRNAVLREIDRRRDAVARRLREAATIIEDAEFKEIAPARQAAFK